MLDLLVDLVGMFDRSDTLYAAYRAAWKQRTRSGDESVELLVAVMKNRGVPGAYDVHDSVRIEPAVRAWTSGVPPRVARREIRNAPTRRPAT